MRNLLQMELPFLRLFGRDAVTPTSVMPAPKKPIPRASSGTAREEACSITFSGQHIAYTLRRSPKRRSIALQIDARGLRVAAPVRATLRDAEEVLYKHADWVTKKLREWHAPTQTQRRAWQLGNPLLYLGHVRPLRILQSAPGVPTQFIALGESLQLSLPQPPTAPDYSARVRATLDAALREAARQHFAPRLAHYASLIGEPVPTLRLSSAATRWGSCSRRVAGISAVITVSLNWRMIHFPPHLIDYVIAHEIAHIKHMNHSPRFWALVGKLFPDYQAARAEIKRRALELPEI